MLPVMTTRVVKAKAELQATFVWHSFLTIAPCDTTCDLPNRLWAMNIDLGRKIELAPSDLLRT